MEEGIDQDNHFWDFSDFLKYLSQPSNLVCTAAGWLSSFLDTNKEKQNPFISIFIGHKILDQFRILEDMN